MPTRKRAAKRPVNANGQTIKQELEAFYAMLRARALLTAIEWAGSASNLGMLVGYKKDAGITWQRRGRISVEGARRLSKLEDFPLTTDEMCPGQRTEPIQCKRCMAIFQTQGHKTGTSPSFNGRLKSVREARRIHAQHVARRASTSSTPHD